MGTYSFSFFTPGAIAFSSNLKKPTNWGKTGNTSGETASGDPGGGSWSNVGSSYFTITYSTSSLTTVSMTDSNFLLEDDKSNQLVTTTSNSSVVATGTKLEDEYEITVRDSTGATYRMVAISNASGNIIGYTFDGTWPTSGTRLYYVSNSAGDLQSMTFPCFAGGTRIATARGEVAIEDLAEGDLVLTRDHGPQPLRWIGSTEVSQLRLVKQPKLRPIRIAAGALGFDSEGAALPHRDLTVSPQHRILVRSKIAEKMFGEAEVLVPAKQLLQLPGVDIAEEVQPVVYFHLLFDRHEVIFANGAETESLYTGPEALKALPCAAREEILTLFPELATRSYAPSAARVLVSGHQARKLTVRHIQNRKPLVA